MVSLNIEVLKQLPPANECCGKVMFLHLSVNHSVHKGVCIPACNGWGCVSQHAMGGVCLWVKGGTPPWADTPRADPSGHKPPWADTTPIWADTTTRQIPPPPRRQLKRAVCILLQCILVNRTLSAKTHTYHIQGWNGY